MEYGGPIVRCPQCMQEQTPSTVKVAGQHSTMVYCAPFFDEDGRQHIHDSNVVTTDYECSNGHRWRQQSSGTCWCGWPKNQEPEPE